LWSYGENEKGIVEMLFMSYVETWVALMEKEKWNFFRFDRFI
jgi:hypothetical protein